MTRADQDEGEIVPPELAVRAMRDNGYKNTAYALSELIDNSIQAGASTVEVMCVERREPVSQRERRRIVQIAVLDDGSGMDVDVLRKALQFGNGTHLKDRSGIGRFGMGLPNSSISQCRRVTVYTWRNGRKNALMSYLDIDEVEQKKTRVVPSPIHVPVPQEWVDRAEVLGDSGTLIVWQNFDEHRLTWKSARPTLSHTETLIGRIYRKQMHAGDIGIRLCAFEEGETEAVSDRRALVNDPLYMLAPSSTPAPYDKQPMFQSWGEDERIPYEIDGQVHEVVVRASWARPETVTKDGVDRGAKDYGRHAAKNIGLSVVRAGRELQLDPAWCNPSATQERWWGMEIEFPPALDEIFGVTNNKQEARTFASMAQFDWEAEREGRETYTEFKERLKEEGDPRALLIDVAAYITTQIGKLRNRLHDQTKGTRSGDRRHKEEGSVDDRASSQFKDRAKAGHKVPEDDKDLTPENAAKVERDLVKKGYEPPEAKEMVQNARRLGRRVMFVEADDEGSAFFKIDQQPGVTEIVLNKSHPAHKLLWEALDEDVTGKSEQDLAERIKNASDTVKMLLAAWARYEMEDLPNRERIKDSRYDWGRMARVFLAEN